MLKIYSRKKKSNIAVIVTFLYTITFCCKGACNALTDPGVHFNDRN